MPPTISVAAFVFGIVLFLAALIGKDLKIVTVELPALGPGRRVLLGTLGAALTLFGLLDGQMPAFRTPVSPTTAPVALAANAASPMATAPAAATAVAAVPAEQAGIAVLPCLADVAAEDLAILPMETVRRTFRKWSHGQPRAGLLAMQFEDPGGIRGGVKFQTVAAGSGFDIVAVFDAACQPVATYDNLNNPSQPKDHPYNWEPMRYRLGDLVYSVVLEYHPGVGMVEAEAYQLEP